jgi:hypothetical protein
MIELVLVMALLALAIELSPFGIPFHEIRTQATQGLTSQKVVSLASPSYEIKVSRPTQTWLASLGRLREKVTVRATTRLCAQCRPKGRYLSGVPP